MGNIEIFYRDDDLAVCVKPQGALSQDAGAQSVPGLLREALGAATVYPVHRLDQAAGGVMVYALTERAAAALSRAVQNGQLEKTYLAVTQGTPQEPEGAWTDLLFHDQRRNKTFVVTRQRKGVREARLSYRVLAGDGTRSLVAVQLFTGRTHQIRVQFASRGLPLAGDGRYGGRDPRCECALWSFHLAFPHPRTGALVECTKAPPDAFPWNRFPAALLLGGDGGPCP